MNGRFSWFLVAAFLSAQASSFLHAAEHGLESHKHIEYVCSVCLYAEHAQGADTRASFVVATPGYAPLAVATSERPCLASRRYQQALPRAPPVFS